MSSIQKPTNQRRINGTGAQQVNLCDSELSTFGNPGDESSFYGGASVIVPGHTQSIDSDIGLGSAGDFKI
jgi:hypothetical protein